MRMAKAIASFSLAACMACSMTACGKKPSVADEVNQLQEDSTYKSGKQEQGGDTSEDGSGNAAAFQKGELSESLGMKDGHWEETISIGKQELKEIQIKVDVKLPDTDHMSVADLELENISSAQIKEILEKVFDDGKAGIFDMEQYPKWKLEQEIARYEALVDAEKANNDDSDQDWVQQDAAKLESYRSQMAAASDDMVEPASYETGTYWGKIDGKNWQISVSEDASGSGYSISADMGNYQEGLITDIDITGSCGLVQTEVEDSTENACTLSKEAAMKQAAAFLSELGYDEYEVKEVTHTRWRTGWYDGRPDEEFVEGYTVHFGRAIDGVQITTGTEWYMQTSTAGFTVPNYTDEEAIVSITDAGVISFRIQSPRTLKDESVTATSLLSFDKIQNRIKECINEKSMIENAFYPNSLYEVQLTQMDLGYMVYTNEGITVVPVWRIYNVDKDSSEIMNYIIINAIDGSEMDFMSQYYEILSEEKWEEQYGSLEGGE